MAKSELKRIDVTTTGNITIDENGLRLGDSWTDLDDILKKSLGLKSDETIEPIKFNGKITIVIEEVGNTSSNLVLKSTMVDCGIVSGDIYYDKKLSEGTITEIINYLENPSNSYNSRLYLGENGNTRVEYKDIEELTVVAGKYAGVYTAPVKEITIE